MWVKGVSDNSVLRTVAPASVTGAAARITAAPLARDNGFGANQGITLQADSGNGSGIIYIGDDTLTTSNGFQLAAGSSIQLPVFDPYSIWAISSSGTLVLRIGYV